MRTLGLGIAAAAAAAAAFLIAQSLAQSRAPSREGEGESAAEVRRNIENATPASVLILAIDIRDGELVPVSSGSGTVVSTKGAVLTNYHVLTEGPDRRLHDLFAVAKLRAPGRPPEMACAGRPEHGLLAPRVDLALIQCELDFDGLALEPENWPVVSIGDGASVNPGERVWVLGYPDASGLSLRESFGQLLGWTGEDGAPGETYIKTDAAITHGNSGGAAIDARGDLLGVPSAYRVRTDEDGRVTGAVGGVGLIRPIEAATELLERARAGWRPEARAARDRAAEAAEDDEDDARAEPDDAPAGDDGDDEPGDDELGDGDSGEAEEDDPSARELRAAGPGRAAAQGARIASRVVSARTGEPVPGALVAVLAPGADPHRAGALDDALMWSETDAAGAFRMDRPLRRQATYPIIVAAEGYETAARRRGLEISATAPQLYDPWDAIELRPRRY